MSQWPSREMPAERKMEGSPVRSRTMRSFFGSSPSLWKRISAKPERSAGLMAGSTGSQV